MNVAAESPLPIMAIGRYLDAIGQIKTLPYSLEETERARRAINRVLNTFHFRSGSNILITSMFHEGAQLLPVERAVMSHGMVAVSADAHMFDARRVESITRGFPLVAAIGVSEETLAGLEQQGHKPEHIFSNMAIWARPGAYQRLKQNAQLNVYRILDVGPTLAMECSSGNGVHIDRLEWHVTEKDGEITLTNRLFRCVPFQDYRTGIKGRIIYDACQCGNIDPRIELTNETI